MKLPIQKTQHKQEPMREESEMWPAALNLVERYFPEDWFRSLVNMERGMTREMDTWLPRVDVMENKEEYELSADVPGVKPEDIKVEVSGDTLILRGESEEKKEEGGKTWHRTERRSGRFYREFEIPSGVDPNKIEAMADNGILRVKLPKRPETQGRSIEVRSGGGRQGQEGRQEQGGKQQERGQQGMEQQGGQERGGGQQGGGQKQGPQGQG
jgi:HSP20 family protein